MGVFGESWYIVEEEEGTEVTILYPGRGRHGNVHKGNEIKIGNMMLAVTTTAGETVNVE